MAARSWGAACRELQGKDRERQLWIIVRCATTDCSLPGFRRTFRRTLAAEVTAGLHYLRSIRHTAHTRDPNKVGGADYTEIYLETFQCASCLESLSLLLRDENPAELCIYTCTRTQLPALFCPHTVYSHIALPLPLFSSTERAPPTRV